MALYRYVGSKDELLTVMADSAVPPPPERGNLSWRAYLAEWTRLNRDLLLSRPWLLDLRQSTPPIGPRRLLWLDPAMMRSGLLRDSTGWMEDADFRFGLDLLLDGMEALIARSAR